MSKVDLEEIKKVSEMMREEGLQKVSVKHETGFELTVEREGSGHVAAPVHHAPAAPAPAASHKEAAPAAESGTVVTSPMVGIFYASPSPDDPPFAKVGDSVGADTVLCIIEAMKVMNEVKAGCSGVIKEIYIDNGHPVEYGTKLFRIE